MQWPELVINDSHPTKKYRPRQDQEKAGLQHGQKKLLLIELVFFLKHANATLCNDHIVVYAGAAPGHHLVKLVECVPWIKEWHLYDPQPMARELQQYKHVHTYQQIFCDNIAKQWSGANVIFISDIRTADHKQMEVEENEAAIVSDMNLQRNWYEVMKPKATLLKFRLPYAYIGVEKTFTYLDGYLYKQPFAPLSSSECRLVPNGKVKSYDIEVHESMMFYHNDELRKHDFDKKMERSIWKEYNKRAVTHEKNSHTIKHRS